MPSFSPTLLRILTIACCIAATVEAGAQRAEPVGVQPVAAESTLMGGALDPCLSSPAACGPTPQVDRCQSSSYRTVVRTAAGGTFLGAQAILWRYFQNAWWSGEKSDGFFF